MKYFILISLLLFLSCKKKQTIHITAKNAATGEPYPGLTYYVVTYTNINGGTKSKTVATGTLDANGEAVVTERLPKNKGRGVRVVEPENSCYNKNIQLYFSEEDGENFKAEFEFAECAYSKLIINNANCNFGWEHMGCAYWETNGYSDIPMGNVYFRWEVSRNGTNSIYYDTVFYAPGEYKTYEINY